MKRFTVEERRRRIGVRHRLVARAKSDDVAEIARSVIALHGTDPATVFLSAAARMKKPDVATIERALYDERTIVRILAMRRTLWVVPVDLVSMVHAAASTAVAANERRKLLDWMGAGEILDAPQRLRKLSNATLKAIREMDGGFVNEIMDRVPGLEQKVAIAPDTKWGTAQSMGTRVVPLLGVEGHVARGRPRGSWISSQHRWEPIEKWLPSGIEHINAADARTQLVTRWLRAFGPAPVSDLQWWTKWSLGETRKALAAAKAVEVDVDGTPGVARPDDLDATKAPAPWIALLPSLDPTVMGWKSRGWYLGEYEPRLFDRAGNAGPTVWCDGRVVGAWTQLKSGEVAWVLFEDVGAAATAAIEKEAARLEAWLGPVRVTPRFGPRWQG